MSDLLLSTDVFDEIELTYQWVNWYVRDFKVPLLKSMLDAKDKSTGRIYVEADLEDEIRALEAYLNHFSKCRKAAASSRKGVYTYLELSRQGRYLQGIFTLDMGQLFDALESITGIGTSNETTAIGVISLNKGVATIRHYIETNVRGKVDEVLRHGWPEMVVDSKAFVVAFSSTLPRAVDEIGANRAEELASLILSGYSLADAAVLAESLT